MDISSAMIHPSIMPLYCAGVRMLLKSLMTLEYRETCLEIGYIIT